MSDHRKHPILLVDDEPEVLYSLKGLLRREFELHTAESGQQALEILDQHPIHVVMTDQRMPGMTGVELMQRAKAEYPRAIRIVFTGYADIKAVVGAINSGELYRYITKPWDPDELVEVLRDAAARYDADAARQRLVRDVQAYLDEAIELAAAAAPDTPAVSRFDVPEMIERGRTLKERLTKHFE